MSGFAMRGRPKTIFRPATSRPRAGRFSTENRLEREQARCQRQPGTSSTSHGSPHAGVLGIAGERAPQGDEGQTVDAVLDQGAVALERINFASDAARVEALTQTEKLRAALLSSVSHDLRTPLTAILGAAEQLATGQRQDW